MSLAKEAAIRIKHHRHLDNKQYREFTRLEREAQGHKTFKDDKLKDRKSRHSRRVILHEGVPVGFMNPSKKDGFWTPGPMYIGKQHRGAGYAPIVLQHFADKRKNVHVTIDADNKDLVRAYNLSGYNKKKGKTDDGRSVLHYSRSRE